MKCSELLDTSPTRTITAHGADWQSTREHTSRSCFAFHGIGREFNGTLVCSAMAYTKLQSVYHLDVSNLVSLSEEPFYFAYTEPFSQIHERFNKWIDQALVEGLDYWRKATWLTRFEPVLSRNWTVPDSHTLKVYESRGGYQAAQGAGDRPRRGAQHRQGLGAARPWRRRVPVRAEMELPSQGSEGNAHVRQRGRERAGDVQ